jgi:hypothetical protein
MENHLPELSADHAGMLELGAVLGQSHAFGLVAGRCSAAQAASLRRLREEKTYKKITEHWRDFCACYLKMSGAQVDRIIALLEQFGPGYFELAQLTRISADTYKAVEPVVKDHALHFKGEIIELDPVNASKVAAVVAELRREATKRPPNPREMELRLAEIEKRFTAIFTDLETVLKKGDQNWGQLKEALHRMNNTLGRFMNKNKF